MIDDLDKLVVEALEDEDEIRLQSGNNEFYIEKPDFSIIFEYSLDSDVDLYANDDDCSFAEKYLFNIDSILFYDLNSDTEYSVEPNNEIRKAVIQNAIIDNWSGSRICLVDALYEY